MDKKRRKILLLDKSEKCDSGIIYRLQVNNILIISLLYMFILTFLKGYYEE
jgi:hypothetical protein